MNVPRIIPVLLIKNTGLVKTISFKNPNYIGDPINAIKIFNDKEADELVLLDIDASRFKKKIHFDFIKDIVSEAFMPVAYGGGIKSLNDAKQLFSLGVEKIIINTLLYTNPDLVSELVKNYGGQSIVASVDYKSALFYKNRPCFAGGTITIKTGLFDYLKLVEDLGAGEIILQNINKEGTMRGYDLEVIRKASDIIKIPLVSSGGAGNMEDIRSAIDAGASAAAAGSIFVYNGPHKAVLISYTNKIN
jgi:cyclase